MIRKIFFILLLFLLSLPVSGNSIYGENFILVTRLKVWGINSALGYKGVSLLDDRDSILWLALGGRITERGYYRDRDDDYYSGDFSDYDSFRFWASHINWGAGLTQGLIDDPRKESDLLSVSLFYKGVREFYNKESGNDQILFTSVRDDRKGLFLNSFIAEILVDDVLYEDESGLKSGFSSSLTLEYAPKTFFNDIIGSSDFLKYSFSLSFFVPMKKFDNDGFLSCIYAGNSTIVDYLTGDDIPLYARHFMTSSDSLAALGGLIRGYELYRFDAEFKASNRSEVRFLISKIPLRIYGYDAFLRFSTICFFDMGWYDMLQGTDGGFLCSTGVGALASFMDTFSVSCYFSVPINEDRLDKKKMVPVLGFNFKF